MRALRRLIFGLGTLAVLLTALPFIPSNHSLVRLWDFPRGQIAALLAAVLLVLAWFLRRPDRRTVLMAGAVLAALIWQIIAIFPYSSLAPEQAKAAPACDEGSRLSVLTSNVYMENEDAARLREAVTRSNPDVVLLMETDEKWDRRLAFLRATHPHTIAKPLNNTYGMHLFSRLPLHAPQVRYLVEKDVPSFKTGIRLRSGARVDFYGLHPKPPPHQDTAQRDAELVLVAREVAKSRRPALVLGDLNDVAWSSTTHLFQEVSGLLDPRIGRGTFATFNANWPLLRWPLDHVFFAPEFQLERMEVLGPIGSDHFPVFVALCHHPAAAELQKAPRPEREDLDDAAEVTAEGREEEDEDEEEEDEEEEEEDDDD